MTEANLRRYHRVAGIALVAFVALQAATGLYFTAEDLDVLGVGGGGHEGDGSPVEHVLGLIHHGLGLAGAVYRTATGLGLLFLALTGVLIWLRIRARTVGSPLRLRPVPKPGRPSDPKSGPHSGQYPQ